jgi:endonuclease/exonuclease/phosphatase family metal-dependent hydrolase
MHRRILFLSVLGLLGAVLAPAHASLGPVGGPKCAAAKPPAGAKRVKDDGVIRIANLNVLHGLTDTPPDYPASRTLNVRTSLAATQIARAGVDIVGMEEVSVVEGPKLDPKHPLEVAPALAARAAKATGTTWYWCWFLANPHFPVEPDLQSGGGGPISEQEAQLVSQFTGAPYAKFKEGLAIISRWPIVDSEGLHLPGRIPAEAALCPFGPDGSTNPATIIAGLPDVPSCVETVGFETRAALWARMKTPAGLIDLTTTHLAHGITAGSGASRLQQVAVALAFSDARSQVAGAPAHRFFTCDCNSQPEDDVPVIGYIESQGWMNTLPGDCASDGVCTGGPDKIVTPKPRRIMNERIDYVFARQGTCTKRPGLIVNTPLAPGARIDGLLNPTRGYLWPSDHIGVSAALC